MAVSRILVHAGALAPLAWLAWDYWQGQLGANPIERIQTWTGRSALVLLLLSLAITPAIRVLGLPRLRPLRETLGLYAFAYACLHLLNFVGLDYGFDVGLLRQDIFEKWYALLGLGAWLALLPLAVTSTVGWRRRLGRNWARLHRLVYLAAALVAAHFLLQTRGDITLPLAVIAVIVLLLLARVSPVRRAAGRISRRRPPGRRHSRALQQ